MIEQMLQGSYGEKIQLVHVRMAFSREIDEVGKFQFRKLAELSRIIVRIAIARFRHGARILYYPPAGPTRNAVLRDVAILLATRWLFAKTIFHFHAGGLGQFYEASSQSLRFLCRLAYFHPDVAIRLSAYTSQEGKTLEAKGDLVIPYGIEDAGSLYLRPARQPRGERESVRIVFVGAVSESKGVMTLLEACRLLAGQGVSFQVRVVGQFGSREFEQQVRQFLRENGLEGRVAFLNVLTGSRKWEEFAAADIFCFPTHYESESFSVVLLEALSFGLPVVSTRWRGIPGIVEDGVCGFLVPVQDPEAVAERLRRLIQEPELRSRMGAQGRKRYLEQFTIGKFTETMRAVFRTVAGLPG